MRQWEEMLHSAVEPESSLDEAFETSLEELNVTVSEFCEHSNLPESTVYKIKSGHRNNVQLDSFIEIIHTLKRIENDQEPLEKAIAVITNRESLEDVPNQMDFKDQLVSVHGYPSSTVEEAIRQSILAEKDGVNAIVCGPITAYTIEEIVHVPVIGLDVSQQQVSEAINTALGKME